MNLIEDSVAHERLRELEALVRSSCENTSYIVDGSAAAKRFLVSKPDDASTVLYFRRQGSKIRVWVTAAFEKPENIYEREYVANEEGLQDPTDECILTPTKTAISRAFSSFDSTLRVS